MLSFAEIVKVDGGNICIYMLVVSNCGVVSMKITVAKLLAKVTTKIDGRRPRGHTRGNRRRAFTLIELMAVILVVLVLAAIGMGVAGYVQKKVAVATTKSQIAAIELALENYKSDWGYYPPTSPFRISANGMREVTNAITLYNALCPTNPASGRKVYLRPSPQQVKTNVTTQRPILVDPWGGTYNYYSSPTTPFSVVNTSPPYNHGYTLGGQVNGQSFDLFSYGPDHYTFVPGACGFCAGQYPWFYGGWTSSVSSVDDVANWQ